MMPRFENKYLVPVEKLQQLRNFILPYVEVDNYATRFFNNTYTVRSIYFDTPNLKFYREKINGLSIRKKLRIRGYNSLEVNSKVFLEIKRKIHSSVSKNRAPVEYESMPALIATSDIDSYAGLLKNQNGYLTDAQKFLYHIRKQALAPVIKIIYAREAYFYKFNPSLRVTFDKSIQSSLQCSLEELYGENNVICALPKHFILEIKGQGAYPGWLQFLVGKMELRLQALSKYVICIDSHRKFGPLLPHTARTTSKAISYTKQTKQEVLKNVG